jgi:hypothetical protein
LLRSRATSCRSPLWLYSHAHLGAATGRAREHQLFESGHRQLIDP